MPTITGTDHEAKCENCGSTMTFTNDEVRAGEVIPGDEDGDHSGFIICANKRCKRPVRVRRTFTRMQAEAQRQKDLYDG